MRIQYNRFRYLSLYLSSLLGLEIVMVLSSRSVSVDFAEIEKSLFQDTHKLVKSTRRSKHFWDPTQNPL